MATLMHLTLGFTVAGPKRASIGLDFETDNAITTIADLTAWGTGIVTTWNTGGNLRNVIATSHTLTDIELFMFDIAVNPGGTPPFRRDIAVGPIILPVGTNGARAGSPAPPQVAIAVSFKGNVSSRRRRGRVYLPSPPQQDLQASGALNAAYHDVITTEFQEFVAAVEAAVPPFGNTATHVVVSLQGNLVTTVEAYDVRNRVDTQRRRLLRSIDV